MKKNKVSPSFDLFSGYFWEFWGQMGVLGDWLMLNIIQELNLNLTFDYPAQNNI